MTTQDILWLLNIAYNYSLDGEIHTSEEDVYMSVVDATPNDSRSDEAPTISTNEEADAIEDRLDPMRVLIAQFAASQLDILRRDDGLKQMIANGGDVVTDIMSFVRPRDSL